MSGTRHNEGKAKLSLVFEADKALAACAQVLMFGLKKYSRGNWLKGLKYTELCDSLGRHMTAFLAGQDLDVGPNGEVDLNYSGLPHPDLMLCNALFLSQMYHANKAMDDRNCARQDDALVHQHPDPRRAALIPVEVTEGVTQNYSAGADLGIVYSEIRNPTVECNFGEGRSGGSSKLKISARGRNVQIEFADFSGSSTFHLSAVQFKALRELFKQSENFFNRWPL